MTETPNRSVCTVGAGMAVVGAVVLFTNNWSVRPAKQIRYSTFFGNYLLSFFPSITFLHEGVVVGFRNFARFPNQPKY